MSKFRSHEEYDHWRSQQALKRQGAKDLETLDAEHPVYVPETRRLGTGLLGYLVLASVCIVCVLSFTTSGKVFLGRIVALLSRLQH